MEFKVDGFYFITELANNAPRLFGVAPALARAALEADGTPPYTVLEADEIIKDYKNRQVDAAEEDQPQQTPRTITQKIFTSEDKDKLDTLWNQSLQMNEDFTEADLIRVFED